MTNRTNRERSNPVNRAALSAERAALAQSGSMGTPGHDLTPDEPSQQDEPVKRRRKRKPQKKSLTKEEKQRQLQEEEEIRRRARREQADVVSNPLGNTFYPTDT